MAVIEEGEVAGDASGAADDVDLDHIRPDLEEVLARHEKKLDQSRPAAVERRANKGQRTARTNVEDLCDPGTFVESMARS